jgi:hypothetical protein
VSLQALTAALQCRELNDLLADHIMANVDHVTTILRDKPSPEQMNQLFAAEDAALQDDVQTLLGADGPERFGRRGVVPEPRRNRGISGVQDQCA